jgi:hypothetical protein
MRRETLYVYPNKRSLHLAITVLSFDNVQFVDFNPVREHNLLMTCSLLLG